MTRMIRYLFVLLKRYIRLNNRINEKKEKIVIKDISLEKWHEQLMIEKQDPTYFHPQTPISAERNLLDFIGMEFTKFRLSTDHEIISLRDSYKLFIDYIYNDGLLSQKFIQLLSDLATPLMVGGYLENGLNSPIGVDSHIYRYKLFEKALEYYGMITPMENKTKSSKILSKKLKSEKKEPLRNKQGRKKENGRLSRRKH